MEKSYINEEQEINNYNKHNKNNDEENCTCKNSKNF